MKYEIWLGEDYTLFERGIAHLDDGRKLALMKHIHVATYGKDSVLIDDEEHYDLCRFPLRWFPVADGLDLYAWDDISTMLFHNESKANIRIDRFGVLRPDESIEVLLHQFA